MQQIRSAADAGQSILQRPSPARCRSKCCCHADPDELREILIDLIIVIPWLHVSHSRGGRRPFNIAIGRNREEGGCDQQLARPAYGIGNRNNDGRRTMQLSSARAIVSDSPVSGCDRVGLGTSRHGGDGVAWPAVDLSRYWQPADIRSRRRNISSFRAFAIAQLFAYLMRYGPVTGDKLHAALAVYVLGCFLVGRPLYAAQPHRSRFVLGEYVSWRSA